jgi:hypothetical protein
VSMFTKGVEAGRQSPERRQALHTSVPN